MDATQIIQEMVNKISKCGNKEVSVIIDTNSNGKHLCYVKEIISDDENNIILIVGEGK